MELVWLSFTDMQDRECVVFGTNGNFEVFRAPTNASNSMHESKFIVFNVSFECTTHCDIS